MLFLQLRGRLHQRIVHLRRAAIFHHSSGWVKWCLLLFFISQISYSQEHLGRVTPDFRISADSTPSTFVQKNIRLFPKGNSGFVAAWEDDRDGELSYYAQQFDTLGNKVGGNYKTFSNQNWQFLPGGSHLEIDTTYSDFLGTETLTINGSVYDSQGNHLRSIPLAFTYLPWCGTGYLGINYSTSASDENYYFLFRNDGVLSLSRIDKEGNKAELPIDVFSTDRIAYQSSVAAQPLGDHVVAWSDYHFREVYDTASHSSHVEYKFDFRGTFFSGSDSIYAHNVSLGFSNDSFSMDMYSIFIKVICLQDSIYEVFAIKNDPEVLLFRKFDRFGNPLISVEQVFLPTGRYGNLWSTDFSISNITNNTFKILVRGVQGSGSASTMVTSLFSFDLNGLPIAQPIIDSVHLPYMYDHFIAINDSINILGNDDGEDVYLNRYRGLISIDSTKVNDDTLGSNEGLPVVTSVTGDKFFVSWLTGGKIQGQMITTQGEKVGPQREFQSKFIRFFPEDKSVNLWTKKNLMNENMIGFTLYDGDGGVSRVETVETTHEFIYPGLAGSIEKITDTSFVVSYSPNNVTIQLKLYTLNGDVVSETEFRSLYGVGLPRYTHEDDSSFWILSNRQLRRYSNDLRLLSDSILTKLGVLYLEQGRYLSLEKDMSYGNYYSRIYGLNGDTLSEKIEFAIYPNEMSFYNLPSHRFMVLLRIGKTIVARTYFNDGRIDHDSVIVRTNTDEHKKDPSFSSQNGNIIFVWVEARFSGRGYDIYGRVMPVSSVLDVSDRGIIHTPKEFILYQNYPNPFNPSTTIRYIIPKQGNVSICIYDVLGRQIVNLVNEVQTAGEHIVTWNAEGVPSGVYFYRITSNDITVTKKLMLLH